MYLSWTDLLLSGLKLPACSRQVGDELPLNRQGPDFHKGAFAEAAACMWLQWLETDSSMLHWILPFYARRRGMAAPFYMLPTAWCWVLALYAAWQEDLSFSASENPWDFYWSWDSICSFVRIRTWGGIVRLMSLHMGLKAALSFKTF